MNYLYSHFHEYSITHTISKQKSSPVNIGRSPYVDKDLQVLAEYITARGVNKVSVSVTHQ